MTRNTRSFNWGALVACGLRLAGWCAGNALMAAGLIAFATYAIGSFSLPLTMAQLANLANRYGAASVERRDQFDQIVILSFFGLQMLVALFRRAGFVRAFDDRTIDD